MFEVAPYIYEKNAWRPCKCETACHLTEVAGHLTADADGCISLTEAAGHLTVAAAYLSLTGAASDPTLTAALLTVVVGHLTLQADAYLNS